MKGILKRLCRLLSRRQKIRILILVAMMVVVAFLETLGVSLVLPIISLVMDPQTIMENQYMSAICQWLHLTETRQALIIFLAGMIAVFLGKSIFSLLLQYAQVRFIYNSQYQMQGKMLSMYLTRPYQDFLYFDTPRIMRVISGEVRNIYVILLSLMSAASELVVAVFLCVAIFVINPLMTCIAMGLLLLTMLCSNFFIRPRLFRWGKTAQEESVVMSRWLLRSFEGIKEIKIGEMEGYFYNKYVESGKRYLRMEKRNTFANNLPRMLTETIFFVGMLALILIFVIQNSDMSGMFAQLTALAMAAVRLMPAVNRINTQVNQAYYLRPSIDIVIDALEEGEQAVKEKASAQTQERWPALGNLNLQHSIELKGIDYVYPKTEKYIFRNADMEIPVGMSVGIVGMSGAGKTTLVDIMMGLLQAEAGTILLDGVEIESDRHKWLSMIGYIPQTIFLMDDTIRANVALGVQDKDISDTAVWRALEEAQVADHVRSLQDGLDTYIGERGVRLSGGQRQRLGIARALYKNPPILVFDEATSALDNDTESALMETINGLHGKKTIIIIAHRLTTIEKCDLVYRVENGQVERER